MNIYLYAFLVGLYSVFPRYIELFSINVSNLIAGAIFIMTFLFCPKIYKSKTKRLLIALFPFWLNLIYRFGAYVYKGIYVEAVIYFITTILLCVSLCLVINSHKRFELILDFILNFAGIICIYGIIECITQTNVLFVFRNDPFIDIRNGIYRISTTFDHPIVYANYLGIILMLIAYKIYNSEQRRTKRKYILLYCLAVLNLFMTVSRSAIIVIALFQLILFYCLEQRSRKISIILKFLVFPILGVISLFSLFLENNVFQSNSINQVFADLFNGGFTSIKAVGDRFALYSWVWEATKNNSLWGNGINAIFEYQRSYNYVKNSIEVEYLFTFFKLGFVGLVILVASYVSVLRYARKNRVRTLKKRQDFNFFVYLLLLAYFIILFAVTQQTDIRIYFIVVCLCISYSQLMNKKKGML